MKKNKKAIKIISYKTIINNNQINKIIIAKKNKTQKIIKNKKIITMT